MNTMRLYILQHKLKAGVYAMLVLATIISMILVRVHLILQPQDRSNYDFLLRNLFLAWIPALIATLGHALASSRKSYIYLILPLGTLLWLIFFPNAPYLLTDFQHLRLYSDSPSLWFDVVLVIWCAFTGLFLGLVSLYLMQQVVSRLFGRTAGWVFVVLATAICSAGIYVGRFQRFTSLGVLRSPFLFVGQVLEQTRASTPSPWVFVPLYALFLLFIYLMVRFFGSLVDEDAQAS